MTTRAVLKRLADELETKAQGYDRGSAQLSSNNAFVWIGHARGLRESAARLRAEAEKIPEHETGPENSREEVSPMGRSPQRDCSTRELLILLTETFLDFATGGVVDLTALGVALKDFKDAEPRLKPDRPKIVPVEPTIDQMSGMTASQIAEEFSMQRQLKTPVEPKPSDDAIVEDLYQRAVKDGALLKDARYVEPNLRAFKDRANETIEGLEFLTDAEIANRANPSTVKIPPWLLRNTVVLLNDERYAKQIAMVLYGVPVAANVVGAILSAPSLLESALAARGDKS